MKVSVVVGGQFGSEAKGAVTAALTRALCVDGQSPAVVRVAGPNAGHTAYDTGGVAWALRTVPVGVVVDRAVPGHIAAGSELDLPVLFDELDRLDAAGLDVSSRLTIDPFVTLLTESHHQAEHDAGIVARIGSTGKGIGAARADRIMRTAPVLRDLRGLVAGAPVERLLRWYPEWAATQDDLPGRAMQLDQMMVDTQFLTGTDTDHIIIEGTQGYGLGLHTRFYPQCTSSDTTAPAFLAMAGLTPWSHNIEQVSVIVCARTFPIRVAGNSGPLKGETTWSELGLDPELTTVTKKVRRVGAWDPHLVQQALVANGATEPNITVDRVFLALTMFDQVYPHWQGLNAYSDPAETREAMRLARKFCGYPVTYLGTGPDSHLWDYDLLHRIMGEGK